MAILFRKLAPADVADVDLILQDSQDLLLREPFPTLCLSGTGNVNGRLDSLLSERPLHGSRRPKLLDRIEEFGANNFSPLWLHCQPSFPVGDVTVGFPSIPQSAFNSVLHDRTRSLGSRFSFQLGKHHDDRQHGPAHGLARVHQLADTVEIDVMLLKELQQVREVGDAPRDAIELGNDDRIDRPYFDGGTEPLQLRSLLILRTPPRVDEIFDLVSVPTSFGLSGLDVAANGGLLGL